MTNDRTMYAPTPLERFIDFLTSHTEIGSFSEQGTDHYRNVVRAALPFIPNVILSGHWYNGTGESNTDAIALAIDAACNTLRTHHLEGFDAETTDQPEEIQYREQEARYIVGLLVGLALANVLRESRGE